MPSALINIMTAAAEKASKGLLRDFGEVGNLQIAKKGAADFVTESDKRAEHTLMRELSKARPNYGFLNEESGETPGKKQEYRWIINPLDGTHNFIHAIPYFCISIALEKTFHDGHTEIVAACIYDPLHNEMFTAEKGEGAFLNGNRKLNVSNRSRFEEAMMVIAAPHPNPDGTTPHHPLLNLASNTHASLRNMGAWALDLAHLAAGRLDAVCLVGQQPWDAAAAWLLIAEAGGTVTELSGNPFRLESANLLATNGPFYDPLLKLLAQNTGS